MSQSQRLRNRRASQEDEVTDENRLKNAALHILAMENQPAFTRDADLKKQMEIKESYEYKKLQQNCDDKFASILGIKLCHMDGKIYTRSNLGATPIDSHVDSLSSVKQGFLVTILTAIFMYEYNLGDRNKKSMTEEKFWEFLNTLGLFEDKIDDALGDIRKLVARTTGEFFHNGWLHVDRARIDGTTEHYYEWGPRAIVSVNPLRLLEWYCEVDGSDPKDWVQHYDVAKAKSKEWKATHKSRKSYFT